jgi:hypothetical protein
MRALRLAMSVALTAAVAQPAFSAGLFVPFSMDSASTMPKGIRSVRVGNFTTQIEDKYDGYGAVVPAANSFNKSVTWRKLIDSEAPGPDRGILKGGVKSMQDANIDLDAVAGVTHGMVNVRLTSTVPMLAYGLTEKITLGVGLPVVYSSTSIATGWTADAAMSEKLTKVMASGFESKVMSLREKLQNVVRTQIASYGYKPLEDEQRQEIGDVTLGLKYKVFSGELVSVALAPKLVVPTGRTADVNKVVDVAPGDGQFDTGVSAVADWAIAPRFTMTTSAGYTYQWGSAKAKRIPRSADESISPDVETVWEKFGDVMGTSLGGKYKPNDLTTVGLGYSLQYKQADEYGGSAYAAERYGYLAKDTWQSMQAVQASLGFTTVPLYRAGVFPVPADLGLTYGRVLSGRNVNDVSLVFAELAAYF